MKPHLYTSFLFSTAFALLLVTVARADDNVSSIKFSDPTKPGTIKIVLARGDLHIRGDDTAEVSVKSDAKPKAKAPRKDGLRVLTESSSFGLTEKGNVVTLDALSENWRGSSADFRITVPHSTTVIVAKSYGGDITCGGISGDIEIKSLNGEVTLTDISGGAIVDTSNGEIHASVRELHDGKPLSFTSLNGEVILRVPSDAKANVNLRTQNGVILTDFDEKALVTKTESVPRSTNRKRTTGSNTQDDIHTAVRVAVQAGMQAAHEAAAAAREAAQAAREAVAEARSDGDGAVPAVPPVPPMPALPPMTGGKLVYGALNGGGPEISITTMNGDVTLRQLESKK